jgi:hypothetical protein
MTPGEPQSRSDTADGSASRNHRLWRITGIYEKVIKVKADVAAVLD